MAKETFDSLEDYITKIVKEQCDEIKKEDAEKIVDTIMPLMKEIIEGEIQSIAVDIDKMIANKVSEHFHLIGKYIAGKFKLKKGE